MIALLGMSLIGAGVVGVFLASFTQDIGIGLRSGSRNSRDE